MKTSEIDLSPMHLTKESLAEWLRPYLTPDEIIYSWEIIEDRHLRLTIHRKEKPNGWKHKNI